MVRVIMGTAFLAGALWLSRRRQDGLHGLGEPVPLDASGEALNSVLGAAESLYPTVELPREVDEYADDDYKPNCNSFTDEAASAVGYATQAAEQGLSGSKAVMIGAVQAWSLGQFMCDIEQPWVEKLLAETH